MGLPPTSAAPSNFGNENMAFYEHVVITRPDISPAQVETFVEEMSTFLTEKGATVGRTEYWGLRSLAYPIKKQRKGHYSCINIDAPAEAIHELERRQRISEDVMRYLTVRVEAMPEEPSVVLSRKERRPRD
jgi:small subunit ribosomal protein S6